MKFFSLFPQALRIDNNLLGITILSLAVFAISLGLSYPLFALRLESMGYSSTIIGFNAALAGLSALIIAPYSIRIIMQCGFYNTLIYAFIICALSYIISGLFPNLYVFMLARFFIGLATTLIFVVGESILNMMIDDKRRGKIQGIYAAMISAGFAVGPLLVSVLGSHTIYPFLVAFVIIMACILPIIYNGHDFNSYTLHNETHTNIWDFFKIQPAILIGIFCVSYFEQSSISLFPLYFLSLDFTESQSMNLLTLMIISNVLFMPIFGILLDRIPIGILAISISVLTIALSTLLHFFAGSFMFYIIILFLGMVSFCLYPLCFTDMGKNFTGSMLISGTAGISLAWALGSLVGPSINGVIANFLGIHFIPFVISLVYGIYIIAYIRQKSMSHIHITAKKR